MEKKRPGRPKKEEHRKLRMRFAKVEDTFLEVISQMENEEDKQIVIEALENLKMGAIN